MIHPESISKMLPILGILSDHIANSQVTGDYMILKNTKKNNNYVETGSKCGTFYMPYTHSQYFRFS